VTFEGAAAEVMMLADWAVSTPAPPPMVAVMVVASVAQLLGVNDVVTVPAPLVVPEVGESIAVKPECGAVVTEKVTGTPGWVVPSFAVMVMAAPPAVKAVAAARTLTDVAPFRS